MGTSGPRLSACKYMGCYQEYFSIDIFADLGQAGFLRGLNFISRRIES